MLYYIYLLILKKKGDLLCQEEMVQAQEVKGQVQVEVKVHVVVEEDLEGNNVR